MAELVNLDRKPLPLSSGRTLAPGEAATHKITPHEQTLIDLGQLGVRPIPTRRRRTPARTTQED